MKKIISVLMAITMILSLCSCSKSVGFLGGKKLSFYNDELGSLEKEEGTYSESGDEYEIKLPEDGKDQIKNVTYSILGKEDESDGDGYYKFLSGRKAEVKDNKIEISKSQDILTLYLENLKESMPICDVIEKREKDKKVTWNVKSIFFGGMDVYRDNWNVDTVFTVYDSGKSKEGNLKYDITKGESWNTKDFEVKNLKNANRKTVFQQVYTWERCNDVESKICLSDTYVKLSYEMTGKEFNFQKENISDLSGKYYAQVTVVYKDGKQYSSKPLLLNSNEGYAYSNIEKAEKASNQDIKQKTIKTEKGKMTFDIYSDYAVLSEYKGEDTKLTIPDEVDNVSVKKIGNDTEFSSIEDSELEVLKLPSQLEEIGTNVFSYCSKLKNLSIPDTVKYIGTNSFSCISGEVEYKTFKIGKNLTYIGDGVFSGMAIHNFEVDKKNPRYQAIDGIIYTKDKKTLCLCPSKKSGTLTIPAGVTCVREYAFDGNGTSYDNSDKGITQIILSDTVAEFDSELPGKLKRLEVGSGLKIWDPTNLCQTPSADLTISENNKSFKIIDGIVYNGDETELLYVYDIGMQKKLVVPETVESIGNNAFENAEYVEKLSLPKSLELDDEQISDLSLTLRGLDSLKEIQVDQNNSSLCSIDGVLYTKNKLSLVTCPNIENNKKLTLTEGCTLILDDAFLFSNILETIEFPASFGMFSQYGDENSALSSCDNLRTIKVDGKNPYFTTDGKFLVTKGENKLIYAVSNYDEESLTLPEGVEKIDDSVFGYGVIDPETTIIKEIHIPDGVTEIGEDNFEDMTYTTYESDTTSSDSESDYNEPIKIYLPDSLEKIDGESFRFEVNNYLDSTVDEQSAIMICAKSGTYAEKYAKKYDIPFKKVK